MDKHYMDHHMNTSLAEKHYTNTLVSEGQMQAAEYEWLMDHNITTSYES